MRLPERFTQLLQNPEELELSYEEHRVVRARMKKPAVTGSEERFAFCKAHRTQLLVQRTEKSPLLIEKGRYRRILKPKDRCFYSE